MSYEMTTSVRFCLSYDLLNWDIIAFKMNIISIRERIVDTDVVNDITYTRQMLLHVWSYDFYDMCYTLNNSDVI